MINFKVKKWNIEEETGYKPLFTFYEDFSIAEGFGVPAVWDTCKSVLNEWGKHDYKALTELAMVLNWKSWEHVMTRPDLSESYDRLWEKVDEYATHHLEGDELRYYYKTTD